MDRGTDDENEDDDDSLDDVNDHGQAVEGVKEDKKRERLTYQYMYMYQSQLCLR